jgi:hypothetical protein
MPVPYLCPACGTNRSRFNVIEQVVQSVRKYPRTGEVLEVIPSEDPLQHPYRAEKYRVQCGVCGVIEPEERFIQRAIHNRLP